MSKIITRLLIRVNGKPAGHLSARGVEGGGTRYSFTYLPNAGPEQVLSLTMPVRDESYSSMYMLPALEMSLPEGLLKVHLTQRFSKTVSMDPMGLLFVTGRSRIGSITAELPPGNTDAELIELDKSLLQQQLRQDAINSDEITNVPDEELEPLFERLLQRYAVGSGVGGMQTKVLAKTMVRNDKVDRLTMNSSKHMVKTSGNEYPYLSLNEHLCLKVADKAGLGVPRRILSGNGEVLILERFDLRPDGGRYHFEDGCVLQARRADDKYKISMEKLTKSLLAAVSATNRQAAAKELFTLAVVNTLVRNGDAHAKNFAIVYDRPENVGLTKAFDITTTAAYSLYRHDKPALTLHNKNSWPSERDLIRYGREHCRLNDRDCRKVIQDAIGAVTETGKTIPKEIEEHPGSEHVLSAMAHCWNDAIKSLYFKKDGQKAARKTELDYVVADLTDRYGDPYRNQKDRDERVHTMRAESPLAGMNAR